MEGRNQRLQLRACRVNIVAIQRIGFGVLLDDEVQPQIVVRDRSTTSAALRARGRRVDAHVLDDRQRLDGEAGAFEHRAQLIERPLDVRLRHSISGDDCENAGRTLGESLIGALQAHRRKTRPSTGSKPRDFLRKTGGEGQNRTVDTVIFSHVLYQLSYLAPEEFRAQKRRRS